MVAPYSMWHATLITVLCAALLGGCVTHSVTRSDSNVVGQTLLAGEKQVGSVEQLAGHWFGYYRRPWGQEIRANVYIEADGKGTCVFQMNPTIHQRLEIVDGVMRFGSMGERDRSRWGTARLLEERGKEYLTFTLYDGTLWVECERAR